MAAGCQLRIRGGGGCNLHPRTNTTKGRSGANGVGPHLHYMRHAVRNPERRRIHATRMGDFPKQAFILALARPGSRAWPDRQLGSGLAHPCTVRC